MGRHWYPKRKVVCKNCGWKGIRSTYWTHHACPQCRKPAVEPVDKEESKKTR